MDVAAQFEPKHRRFTVAALLPEQRCIIEGVSLHDTVKVIDCAGGMVEVRGKCKILLVDKSRGVRVSVSGAVCGAEVVNCTDCGLETGAAVPMVAIDKCAGIQLRLGGRTEVITANILGVSLFRGEEFCTIPTAEALGLAPAGRQCLTVFSPGDDVFPSTVAFERCHLDDARMSSSTF